MMRLCSLAVEDRVYGPDEQPKVVDYRLLHSWERGRHGATVRKEGPVLRGLENALDRLETEIFFALAPRFLGAAEIAALKLRHAVADSEPAGAPAALPREEAAL